MRRLALAVLVLGFAFVWLGYSPVDPPDDECPPWREGQTLTYEAQWWPPGTHRCEVFGRGGRPVAATTVVPWFEYGLVAVLALAIAVFRPLNPFRWLAALLILAGGWLACFWFL